MRWLWQNLRLKISETIVADAFIAKYIGMKQIELIHFVFIGTNRTAPRVPWTDLSEFRGRPIQSFMDGFFEFGKILYFCIFISVMMIFSFQWSAKFATLNLTLIHLPESNGVDCDVITYYVICHYAIEHYVIFETKVLITKLATMLLIIT